MHELEASLARIHSAWMAGRSALEHCPAEWRPAVEGPHGEAALAALTGHATSVLLRSTPTTALEPRPLLPALALPVMAESLRPRFRRVLASKHGPPVERRQLIDLIASRGHSVHPADWLPLPGDEWVPDLYAPWLDWVRTETKAKTEQTGLTVDTYERWAWAERRVALAQLRIADPTAALAIIAAKAASEPAERRLRLLEILENKLSEADATFLEGLGSDRSERVQAIAQAYLARLGRTTDAGELATELTGMVELGKVGLIKRRTRLVIKPLKMTAQNARRRDLFRLVSLPGLARALGVPESRLVEAPPEGTTDGIESFVRMVATTGSDATRRTLLDGMLADAACPTSHLTALAPRLSAEERRTLLPQFMARDTDDLATTLVMAGPELGATPLSALLASPAYQSLGKLFEDTHGGASDSAFLADALDRIALLLDAPGAAGIAAHAVSRGLSAADPKLDLLHLNSALKTEMTP